MIMTELDTAQNIDFDDFVNGPIFTEGVLTETKVDGMWRDEYASARSFGWTALHLACWHTSGDRERVVRVLLDRGCETEAEDEYTGWRPLHVCASYGNGDAMRVLLNVGCNLTALTADGETALEIAERENQRECVEMLKVAMQVPGLPELRKNNSLSNIVKQEEFLLDKLRDCKDRRALEALNAKQVDEQEIEDWESLKLNQVDSQSVGLQRRLMYKCNNQKYDYGVYSLCSADIVNETPLVMGPTALETAE